MTFHADLHVHSKYSRATSRDLDLERLAWWAARKGISVVGTGDCVHPVWLAEIKDKLVRDGAGLFRLRPEVEEGVWKTLPPACRQPVSFMLSTEISTIYKKGDKTRKVHHLIYVADLDAADRLAASLARIGNIASDGRPILGLDSRDLLEIALESGPASYLVPAHIWTPWFAALGSQSGFDSIADCYGDLAGHIFAVETGPVLRSGDELARLLPSTAIGSLRTRMRIRRASSAARRRASPARRTIFPSAARWRPARATREPSSSSLRRASTTWTATAPAACASTRRRRSRLAVAARSAAVPSPWRGAPCRDAGRPQRGRSHASAYGGRCVQPRAAAGNSVRDRGEAALAPRR